MEKKLTTKPLSKKFYDQTRQNLLNLIDKKNLDGFLITNPANIYYFTGFFYVTNERPSGFYLSKKNKSKLFIPLLEKENAENVNIDNVCIYEEFPGKINPYSFMAENIEERNIGTDIKNIDILNYISNHNSMRPEIVIGFAAETNEVLKNAEEKLNKKNCDWIISNDVSKKNIGFNSDYNEVVIHYKNKSLKSEVLPYKRKSEISEEIVDRIIDQLN